MLVERVKAEMLEGVDPNRRSTPWLCGAKAAAEYLGCGLDRVKRLTAARAIPHRKQDGRVFYRRDELDDWLDAHYEGPPRPLDAVSSRFPKPRNTA